MSIDSHHRMAKDWDTSMIRMLHSCDAGEMSVLTSYPNGFGMRDLMDGYSDFRLLYDPVFAMSFY